jgi:predicted nucleic acid-binding protein
MVPLGNAAAALQNRGGGVETNRIVIAQIELAGFSKTTPWLPDDGVLARLAALYWQLEQSCGIPLKRVANPKRAAAKWNGAAGWLGHADVPENDHVDPRALRYAVVLEIASGLAVRKPQAKVQKHPRRLDAVRTLPLRRRAAKVTASAAPAES